MKGEERLGVFSVLQQPTHKKVFYCQLVWRWFFTASLTFMMLMSMFDYGRVDPKHPNHFIKWFIYLTNWTFFTAVIQSWLAAVICTKSAFKNGQDYRTEDILKKDTSFFGNAYWAAYSISVVCSIFVAIGYWGFVYNPKIHYITFVNLAGHAIVMCLVIGDFFISGHGISLNELKYTVSFGTLYSVFSYIYYICGGLSRRLEPKIYPLLNWQNPERSVIACLVAVVAVAIMHCLFSGISFLRIHIRYKLSKPVESKIEKDFENVNLA